MLVIRLQRTGRKNVPAYRIAVCEKSAPVKGRVKEYVGHYLPTRDPHVLEFDKERVEHWVKMGAQPSDTVARLLKREGVDAMDKYIETYTKKKKRKEVKVPEDKKAEAAIPEQKDDDEKPAVESKEEPPKPEDDAEEKKE